MPDTTQQKVLLIRQLTPGAAAAIKRYQEQKGIKVSTDAAQKMLEGYYELIDQLAEVRRELDAYRTSATRLAVAQKELKEHQEIYDQALKDFAEKGSGRQYSFGYPRSRYQEEEE